MSDQADQLRRLVRETVQQQPHLQPGPPLVVVSGGQEGVGTTTIAIQLAKELKAQGKRTVLVDANLVHPNVANRWSAGERISNQPGSPVNRESRGTLNDVLGGDRTVLEVLQPKSEGVRLLTGCWNADAPPRLGDQALDRLLEGLHRLHDSTDVVVVDLGFGMSPWAHRFWLAAQQVLLVTTPASANVKNCYATLKLAALDSLHKKVRIVVNRCWEKSQARTVFARLDHTCQRFLNLSLSYSSLIAEYPDAKHANAMHQNIEAKDQPVDHSGQVDETSLHADDYPHSVRLLAAEVISHSFVVTGRSTIGCAGNAQTQVAVM